MLTTLQQEVITIRPQAGRQEQFLSSMADITIYGGAAFSGKTYGLLLEPTRHISVPNFSAVIFRRTTNQVRNPGGLWDESLGLYPLLKSKPLESTLVHRFPTGAVVKFAHLEYEKDVHDWDGAQIPLICFDQLEHFTKYQFFYMLSRNRSMCGVRPYVRATCNPDAGSWLAEFIAWWIDEDTGLPIKEHAGLIRWFIRDGEIIIWGNSPEELIQQGYSPDEYPPKSITFIPGNIFDNVIGMKADPGYLANLKALPLVERERLLNGNWKIRPAAGLMWRREWCEMVDMLPPSNDLDVVRYWDLAATTKIETNDPDWTIGVKLARQRSTKIYFLCAVKRLRESPSHVEAAIRNVAEADGKEVRIGIPQDPGQAGKGQVRYIVGQMAGFTITANAERGDKITRFMPFSAQCEAGNVKRLRGLPEDFLCALENFPEGEHDDDADASAGAFNMFQDPRGMGLYEYLQQMAEEQEKIKPQKEINPQHSNTITVQPDQRGVVIQGGYRA